MIRSHNHIWRAIKEATRNCLRRSIYLIVNASEFFFILFVSIYIDPHLFFQMNNMWLSTLSGLLFITALHGSPLNVDTDVTTTDDNGLVYVFNIYAVRNIKSNVVGKMLSHQSLEKMPSMFEPIGSIVLADDDTEPFTLGEFAEFLEDFGVTVDKVDDENDPRVIEVKIDDFYADADYMLSMEDIIKSLRTEGIIIKIIEENDVRVLQIEFDESMKDLSDQPFTLEELANYFEEEGFTVELKLSNGNVKSIKIKLDSSTEVVHKKIEESSSTTVRNDEKIVEKKSEHRPEPNILNAVDRDDDRKIENKIEHNNERIIPLDFVTRSDSLNKIRKRRSTCPECKTANLIKQFITKYPEVN